MTYFVGNIVKQISRAQSACLTETLWALIHNSSLPATGHHYSLFGFMIFKTLDISPRYSHAVFLSMTGLFVLAQSLQGP